MRGLIAGGILHRFDDLLFGTVICQYSCFKDSDFFPEFVINITAIGEETGSLDKSLLRIAVEYEKDVASNIKILTRMLEPAIILIMGLIVGFIVLCMLLPIFQINLIAR